MMYAKKWLMILMVAVLTVTALASCKSPDSQEESAVAGEVVENEQGETVEVENKTPEKVDENDAQISTDDDYVPGSTDNETQTPDNEDPETPGTNGTETPDATPDNGGSEDDGGEDPAVTYKEGNLLKVVSYNVRCANDGPGKQIAERGPRLEIVIDQYDPDIVGFQEVTPTWRMMLEGYFLDEYDYVYKERSPGGECTPVFWKKDKFEKMDEGHFWLSETPDHSSIGFGGEHYRVCSWVRLKVKATGAQFLYFNTHLDFTPEQHVPSVKLMLNRAKAAGGFSKYGVIFTADWNMNPWKQGYSALVESGEMSDVNYDLENLSDGTCNGYNEGDGSGGSIIDMCFYSPAKLAPVDYKVINEKVLDGWVSDHRGIYMEIAIL